MIVYKHGRPYALCDVGHEMAPEPAKLPQGWQGFWGVPVDLHGEHPQRPRTLQHRCPKHPLRGGVVEEALDFPEPDGRAAPELDQKREDT